MATAPNAPAGQETPKAPPTTTALDNLQAMLNLVLITSGRFLIEQKERQQTGDSSGRVAFQMKRTVPVAQERFHDSLDFLESEIRQAQAVFRRDLALLQADRLKREQAEAAERQRLAAESSAKKNVIAKKEEAPADADSSIAQSQTSPAANSPKQQNTQDEPALHRADDDDMPPSVTTPSAALPDPLFDSTPPNGNPQDTEFDFDAAFGDSVGDGGDGRDASNHQEDIDMNAAAPDLNFLAGLEDFAKSIDDSTANQSGGDLDLDVSMSDLPDMNANTTSEQPSTSNPAESSNTQPPAETTEDTNMLEAATIDDLNDLFDLDYENPENTEFDNAFFGFDEN